MEIKTEYIEVQKTARYATYGSISPKTKYYWYVLHGSSMTCEQMLYKFENWDPEKHFIVAPEGLNRLYTKGLSGDPVSTWMTRRDRQYEINDYSKYLSQLHQKYLSQLPQKTKKIILGFSQGGTTMYRWLHHSRVDIDILLSYSSWIPEDIDLHKSQSDIYSTSQIYTYGNQDQYLSQDRIKAMQDVISQNDLSVKVIEYQGTHKVDKEHLKILFEKEIQ